MKIKSRALGSTLAALPVAIALALGTGPVFANGAQDVPLVSLDMTTHLWTDPDSGGQVRIYVSTFEGCKSNPFEMTWQYFVSNLDYDPIGPGPCWDEASCSNGFSGFQIQFDQQIPELHNQLSPLTGGPWEQNAYSGVSSPPWGAEWDVRLTSWWTEEPDGEPDQLGIMPGGWGVFSFCTDERVPMQVNDPPYDGGWGSGPFGWAHSWDEYGQINIFNGPNTIPGDLYTVVGTACSGSDIICKKVKFLDDGDGYVEVGEEVVFRTVIHIHILDSDWTDAKLKDNFGGQLDVEIVARNGCGDEPELKLRGKTEKAALTWNIGDSASGPMHTIVLDATTDITPGGDQSYTECGWHEFNSGAVLKYFNANGKKRSYGTGSIDVPVFTEDMLGDCDGDDYTDAEEVSAGTDPFDPDDHPSG